MKTVFKFILAIIGGIYIGKLVFMVLTYENPNKQKQLDIELDSLKNVKMRAIYQNGYLMGTIAAQKAVFESLKKSKVTGKFDINTVPSIEQMQQDSIWFERQHIQSQPLKRN